METSKKHKVYFAILVLGALIVIALNVAIGIP